MLQNTILTNQERQNLVDMITGSINRICVTDDCNEIIQMIASININLAKLAQSNIISIKEKKENG